MQKYIARRLILFIPTVLLASLGIFVAMRVLPGDVAQAILGSEVLEGDPYALQQLDALREQMGLDEPIPIQYGKWMWSMVNGEFGGQSVWYGESIASIIGRRLPVTLQLTAYTFFLTVIVSVPLGVLAALHQDRWGDYAIRTWAIVGHSLPSFVVALLMILAMVLFLGWSPPIFYVSVWENPVTHFQMMIWPALIGGFGSSTMIRVTRSNMLEVLRQDYVRTARSKGLAERSVVYRHALRNALIPVVTIAGVQMGHMLSGTVILETLFGLPGLGQGVVDAATSRDYPVIQSLAMFLVLVMLGVNLLVDLLYAFIDPRIRYG
jgi:peptide/nickel transport system permease protein